MRVCFHFKIVPKAKQSFTSDKPWKYLHDVTVLRLRDISGKCMVYGKSLNHLEDSLIKVIISCY